MGFASMNDLSLIIFKTIIYANGQLFWYVLFAKLELIIYLWLRGLMEFYDLYKFRYTTGSCFTFFFKTKHVYVLFTSARRQWEIGKHMANFQILIYNFEIYKVEN